VYAALVAASLTFRMVLVFAYSAPAGDGWQYYKLAEELRVDHRFAYAPPPAKPAWSRLPGYPILLAATGLPYRGRVHIDPHVQRAACLNAVFDAVTALLIALLVEAEVGLVGGAIALVLVTLCPILAACSMYALTESFATMLGVAAIFLALRAEGRAPWLVGAGALLGWSQLTRVDTFTLLPAIVLALAWRPSRSALRALVLVGATALVVWLPWPVRNVIQFGHPHFEGTEWLAQDGTPLPSGVMVWMRSWAWGAPGQAYDLFAIANGQPLQIERPGIVLPAMYDDDAEKRDVEDVLRRYNAQKLSPSVDARFIELGRARGRRHPWRQYVVLPWRRLASLWTPIPKYELPIDIDWLGLPKAQKTYGEIERWVFLASLAGLLACWRRHRQILSIAAAAIVGRSLLHATIAHPCPTERYLVECTPFILLAGSIACVEIANFLRPRIRWRR